MSTYQIKGVDRVVDNMHPIKHGTPEAYTGGGGSNEPPFSLGLVDETTQLCMRMCTDAPLACANHVWHLNSELQ